MLQLFSMKASSEQKVLFLRERFLVDVKKPTSSLKQTLVPGSVEFPRIGISS